MNYIYLDTILYRFINDHCCIRRPRYVGVDIDDDSGDRNARGHHYICHCIQQKKANGAAAVEICHRHDARSCVICTQVFSVKAHKPLCALQTGDRYMPLLAPF